MERKSALESLATVREVPDGDIEKKIHYDTKWEITIVVWTVDAQAMILMQVGRRVLSFREHKFYFQTLYRHFQVLLQNYRFNLKIVLYTHFPIILFKFND